MSDIRTAIFSLLSANTTLQTLCGTTPSRIWRGQIPQNPTLDSIAFWVFDSETDITQQGATGLKMVLLMVDCFSQTSTGAAALQAAVESVLSAYQGTVGTIEIQGIFPERENDQYDSEVKSYRDSQIYRVWYGV